MLEGLDRAFGCLAVMLLVSVPLGLWKLVEIIIWLFQHVEVKW